MKRLVLAALAATALISPACAGGFNWQCYHSRFATNCSMVEIGAPAPLSPAETAEREAARQAELEKWTKFCQPVGKTDDMGMVRLSYAHPGCEFGRSE